MGTTDERAGHAVQKDRASDSRDPAPDSIDSVGDELCSEIAHGTRIACLALREALPRVSDVMAAQRIEAAIGLLDQALSRTLDLRARLSNPEQTMS
jgi:hypothetical protein